VNTNYLLWFDLAEHSDLVHGALLKLDITAACNLVQLALPYKTNSCTYEIWNKTSTSNIPNCLLCRLRLLLTLDDRNEGDVNLEEIALSSSPLQLSHRLDERRALDIADCASQLNDTHIRHLLGVIDRNPGNPLNPVLDCIRQVRNHLDRLADVLASTLLLDDVLVDLACGDVVLARERDVEVAFIVAKVKIDFTAIVEDKDFTVSATYQLRPQFSKSLRCLLGGSHSASIDIHVRIDLDRGDVHGRSVMTPSNPIAEHLS
jgi:hypothetical protein